MKEKECLNGEIFSEIVELNGKKFEHLGFRDENGEFEKVLEKLLGKKVKICMEVIE